MSTEATARLNLPLLVPGQAQKELFHNEALAAIDIAVQASVRAVGTNAVPSDPAEGDCWVVGESPMDAWTDHAGAIAGWTAGGWRFVVPREGLAVWNQATGTVARFLAGGWTAGAQRAPITAPQGGSVVDAEARATLAALLTAMQAHGLIAPANG